MVLVLAQTMPKPLISPHKQKGKATFPSERGQSFGMALPSKAVAFSAAETTQERERGGVFGSILQETLFHDDDAELGADGARPGAGELFYCERCPMRLEHFRTSLPTCSPVREAVHGRDFRSVLKY